MLAFILFAILGWCVFATPQSGSAKIVLLVVFVLLMSLWLLVGLGGLDFPLGGTAWRGKP